MSIDFNVEDPQGGQILVYDEITGTFKNLNLTASMVKNLEVPTITNAINLGSGVPVFRMLQDKVLKFKTLETDGSIVIQDTGNTLRLSFDYQADTNALTLGGLTKDAFLQVGNDLSELNPQNVRDNLDVYSKNEAHNQFFEQNKSNTPELDNEYDLGSNGRRFANVYAVNVHGTVSLANTANLATNLGKNGARNNQVLLWQDNRNNWRPFDFKIKTLTDVDDTTIIHNSVLVYDSSSNTWKSVAIANLSHGVDGDASGTITLDHNGKIPISYLPDSITGNNFETIETFNDLPDIGEENVLYLVSDSETLYYWDDNRELYVNVSSVYSDGSGITINNKEISIDFDTDLSTGSDEFAPSSKAVSDALDLKVDKSIEVTLGGGLLGGGDLSSNIHIELDFGNTADTVTEGNDPRLSDAREWVADLVTTLQAKDKNDTEAYKWSPERVWEAFEEHFTDASTTLTRDILTKSLPSEIREDLELGTSATLNIGINSGDVLLVGSIPTTVGNSDILPMSQKATTTELNSLNVNINNHKDDDQNPHNVTKAQVGLDNVDNTADMDKPVSLQQQLEIQTRLSKTANLSDVENVADSRDNLGLGTAATKNFGLSSGEVLLVGSIPTTKGSSDILPMSQKATTTELNSLNVNIDNHKDDDQNPHNVTKAQVGLGNVDDTSDINKPISILQTLEFAKKLNKSNNLSDLTDVVAARGNLELGSAALKDESYFMLNKILYSSDIINDSTVAGNNSSNVFENLFNKIEDHETDTDNPHNVTKEQLGLRYVENTADIDKNVSTALRLTNKRKLGVDLESNTSKDFNGSSNVENIGVSGILPLEHGGLGVDNVSDARTVLGLGTSATLNVGIANGVAALDSEGKVPSSQLPSYVDDVVEFDDHDELIFVNPAEKGKIYVTKQDNKIYRWSGSQYVEISPTVGNSDTATKLYTPRNIGITGDGTWSVTFDGSNDVSGALTLSPSGVNAGTYTGVKVDAKGRVIVGYNYTTLHQYGITDAISVADLAEGISSQPSHSKVPTEVAVFDALSTKLEDAPEDGKQYVRKDKSWEEIIIPDEYVSEAPEDGKQYVRKDGEWEEVEIGGDLFSDAPNDGKQYVRKNETWVELEDSESLIHYEFTSGLNQYTYTLPQDLTGLPVFVYVNGILISSDLYSILIDQLTLSSEFIIQVGSVVQVVVLSNVDLVQTEVTYTGVEEAPNDGKQYSRSNESWVETSKSLEEIVENNKTITESGLYILKFTNGAFNITIEDYSAWKIEIVVGDISGLGTSPYLVFNGVSLGGVPNDIKELDASFTKFELIYSGDDVHGYILKGL